MLLAETAEVSAHLKWHAYPVLTPYTLTSDDVAMGLMTCSTMGNSNHNWNTHVFAPVNTNVAELVMPFAAYPDPAPAVSQYVAEGVPVSIVYNKNTGSGNEIDLTGATEIEFVAADPNQRRAAGLQFDSVHGTPLSVSASFSPISSTSNAYDVQVLSLAETMSSLYYTEGLNPVEVSTYVIWRVVSGSNAGSVKVCHRDGPSSVSCTSGAANVAFGTTYRLELGVTSSSAHLRVYDATHTTLLGSSSLSSIPDHGDYEYVKVQTIEGAYDMNAGGASVRPCHIFSSICNLSAS